MIKVIVNKVKNIKIICLKMIIMLILNKKILVILVILNNLILINHLNFKANLQSHNKNWNKSK